MIESPYLALLAFIISIVFPCAVLAWYSLKDAS